MPDNSDWLTDSWLAIPLIIAIGVALGVLKEALEALRADRPWFGWDLRRLRRSRRDTGDDAL